MQGNDPHLCLDPNLEQGFAGLPFHTVHGVLKARILKWFAIPFSSGPDSVRHSTMTRPSWVVPHGPEETYVLTKQRLYGKEHPG